MQRVLLVPTALAVAALSQAADAKVSEGVSVLAAGSLAGPARRDAFLSATRGVIEAVQKPITPYIVGAQVVGFAIERNECGIVVAAHYSHSSRVSHASIDPAARPSSATC